MSLSNAFIGMQYTSYAMALILVLTVLFLFLRGCSLRWQRPFILLTILCNIIYLIWRLADTLPLRNGVASVVFGILLLAAELMGFGQSAVFRMIFAKPFHNTPHTLSEWPEVPTVDVFIATYNENVGILRKTAIACQNLDYPADKLNIFLCDDGGRAEVHAMCRELGIHYLAREEHAHAKAGNINHALEHSRGEFVMLLDADMVPKSNFLQKTIGNFIDERVGFVQTPQIFYNPDPFQHNLHLNQRIPNEQDLFMLDIQAARANYNAVLHVGTNAVFRRKALDDIGGVPTGTITEDMATGMLIQAKGYRSVFIREVLCTGLSVESFSDLIHQRERWCRGNIQVVKKWNPLTIKGLTLSQRIIYTDGLVYWFFGVQKIIYIICPLVFLVFGTVILQSSYQTLLLFWLPSYYGSFLAYRLIVKQSRSLTWRHIYEVAMSPYLAMAALVEAIFSRPIPFRVTPKGTNADKTTFAFRTAIPYFLLLGLTALGWVITLVKWSAGLTNAESVLINIGWSLYNAFAILVSVLVCIERPRKRISERVDSDEIVTVNSEGMVNCRLINVSEKGVELVCDPVAGSEKKDDPVHISSPTLGEMEGKVVWIKEENHQKHVGIALTRYSSGTYRRLLKLISDKNEGYHQQKSDENRLP